MLGSRFGKKKSDALSGFLGSQTEFAGKLSFSGVVHLDGKFEGEIISRGTLVVGSESIIRARIHSDVLKIAGEVHGDLVATEKIEMYPPARVYGSIRTPSLVVEEGVLFDGKCTMSSTHEETPALGYQDSEVVKEDEPLEAISAQAWPPSFEEEEDSDQGARSESAVHKHGQ